MVLSDLSAESSEPYMENNLRTQPYDLRGHSVGVQDLLPKLQKGSPLRNLELIHVKRVTQSDVNGSTSQYCTGPCMPAGKAAVRRTASLHNRGLMRNVAMHLGRTLHAGHDQASTII